MFISAKNSMLLLVAQKGAQKKKTKVRKWITKRKCVEEKRIGQCVGKNEPMHWQWTSGNAFHGSLISEWCGYNFGVAGWNPEYFKWWELFSKLDSIWLCNCPVMTYRNRDVKSTCLVSLGYFASSASRQNANYVYGLFKHGRYATQVYQNGTSTGVSAMN